METEKHPESEVSPFQQVRELIGQYGSTANIPEEELTAVGYARSLEGVLAPIGIEVVSVTLETKNAKKPFEPFTVKFKSERKLRDLSMKLVDRIEAIEREIDLAIGNHDPAFLHNPHDLGEVESIAESMKYWSSNVGYGNEVDDEILQWAGWAIEFPGLIDVKRVTEMYEVGDRQITTIPLLSKAKEQAKENIPEYPIDEEIIDGGFAVLKAEQLEAVSLSVERRRSQLTDVDEMYNVMDESFGFNRSLEEELKPGGSLEHWYVKEYLPRTQTWSEAGIPIMTFGEVTSRVQELKAEGIETVGDYVLVVLSNLLWDTLRSLDGNEKLSTDIITGVTDCRTLASRLRELELELKALCAQNVKAQKALLKTTPFGQPGREQAEQALNNAKTSQKYYINKLQPFIQIFERPFIAAQRMNAAFNDIQDILYGALDGEQQFTFVSDIDTERDADPGAVSGDCTEGSSLPFLDPTNNLYNVKVFDNGQHIGNIYLLQVVNKDKQPIIWHFDAIQIPKHTSWNHAAPAILACFKEQARAHGVRYITSNKNSAHLSNYDYIAGAFQPLAIQTIDPEAGGVEAKLHKAVSQASPTRRSRGDSKYQSSLQLDMGGPLLRYM